MARWAQTSVARDQMRRFSGVISGTGSVSITGPGQWNFTGANSPSAGSTTVSAGTLVVDNASGSATGTGAVTVSPGAMLQIGNNDAKGWVSGNIANDGTVEFLRSVSGLTYGGVISGSGGVAFVGSGEMILSGANTYSGSTTRIRASRRWQTGPPTPIRRQASACSWPRLAPWTKQLQRGRGQSLGDSSGSGGAVNLANGATLSLDRDDGFRVFRGDKRAGRPRDRGERAARTWKPSKASTRRIPGARRSRVAPWSTCEWVVRIGHGHPVR